MSNLFFLGRVPTEMSGAPILEKTRAFDDGKATDCVVLDLGPGTQDLGPQLQGTLH